MINKKDRKKGKNKYNSIIKLINLKSIIILILLLSFNSYAWFIYSTKVTTGITAKVRAWEVVFKTNENEIVSNLDIKVDNMYPGMETYKESVSVANKGDMLAKLTYIVKKVSIFGEVYELGLGYTSEELLEKIGNDYPFKIYIEIEDETLYQIDGEGKFNITVEWPFESDNDELDTYWGQQSYEYTKQHPDLPSVYFEILLSAEQKTE